MSVQKNFVIRHGFEVSTNLILANADTRRVGVGSTNPQYTLDVRGGIGATNLFVSGIGTISTLKSTNSNINNAFINVGIVTQISGTISTYTTANTSTLNASVGNIVTGVVTNISGSGLNYSGISTLGTVKISSGIVTASSGIVTYYGDGTYLNLSANPTAGIGIGTTGGVVGYGITFINFYGAGVSSSFYNSNAGIATIFFDGGGSGTIGIGTVFPVNSFNGDLFYNIDYARTFVYYDEVELGIGSTAVWVDASPFNVGIITSLTNVSFSPGSATSPSMFFTGDTQTGFFSPGSGQLTIVSSGSSVLNINSSGINVTGVATIGNVQIGTGNTTLIVNGDTRITGILTVGSSSLTLNGNTNTINGVTISSGIVTASSFVGALTGNATGLSGTPNITVGVVTASSFVGALTGNATGLSGTPNITVGVLTATSAIVGSGVTINASGINVTGVVTATSFIGNGSGITGAGSTVFDDTTTNQEFFPLFTSITTGTITASGISTSKLTYNPSTGAMTAVDFNSTSDENLKTNIRTVENSLETINSLRGVSFDWKENGKSSYGVIAQELEEVLPELVNNGEVKSVNYNGLIGVLIEAVKELSQEVQELKLKSS